MDQGESAVDHSESSMDHNESSIDSTAGASGGRGGDSIPEHSRRKEEKLLDLSSDNSGSDETSGLDPQDVRQHVAHEGAGDGNRGIFIRSIADLRNVMKLGNLSQVTTIDLYMRNIGSGNLTLAEALASGKMSALQELSLLYIESDGSEAIGNALSSGPFPCLTHIKFSGCAMGTKGVKALGHAIRSGNLEKLERLWLGDNGINDEDMVTLATAFQHGEANPLPNLKELALEGNSFEVAGMQSLVEVLISGSLDSLIHLNIQDYSWKPSMEIANALVSAFEINHCLATQVFFLWHKFTDLERRYNHLRERNQKNKEILAGLRHSPMVPAAFGKVFLCGSPMVGKTTLSHTLQRGFGEALFSWQRKPHVEERTRGIEVSRLSSKVTKKIKNPIELLVWDMAGQHDYHLVHNAFFPDLSFSEGKATTFVIVCDSRSREKAAQQLEYWLQYVASSCHKTTPMLRHVFVAMNNFGGAKEVHGYAQHWERVLEDQRDKFNGYLKVHTDTFVLDVRRRGEVIGFKKCLLEHSSGLLNDEKVPEICNNIQQCLPAWSKIKEGFPVLSWKVFVEDFCRSLNLLGPEDIIEAATKYLHEAGVLIYIDKNFPSQWGIPYQKLVVLDVNWFCKNIVGEIFLSEDMVNQRQHLLLFRKRVNATTGFISIANFKEFFDSKWSEEDFEHLITILLWLGLCYKGNEDNVCIPSLIDTDEKPGDQWKYQGPCEDDQDQWVMGFSIEHKDSGMTLAPMSLWHRFQVALAQTHKFNGEVLDNDFVARKCFTTFNFDYMNVLIKVDAIENIPTFHEISIFVKPKSKKDELDAHERKQRQVDLAHYLVEILLGLWDDICGGVEYVRKVVWPWPVSAPQHLNYIADRNKEVVEIERSVQIHGIGRKMQWTVGLDDSAITEDQLLSTNGKMNVIKSMESDLTILRERLREAVSLRIYPPQLIETLSVTREEIHMANHQRNRLTKATSLVEYRATKDRFMDDTQPVGATHRILKEVLNEVKETRRDVGEVIKKLSHIENILQEGFTKVLKEQKKAFHKLQETQRFFEEDKDRTCPNLIYLGEKDSGAWATLKQALSPAVHVCLNFACEAKYDGYRPHFVQGQQGVDVSALRPSLSKIVPWLKVSLTILSIAAKVGANFVAPGVGLILPNFEVWQQASSLSEGIEWATGFPKVELDKLMVEGMRLGPNETPWTPQDVYGKSREAITTLIGDLSPRDYEQKFGLRKVCLRYKDGSLHGVVWICSECLRNFRESNLVSEG